MQLACGVGCYISWLNQPRYVHLQDNLMRLLAIYACSSVHTNLLFSNLVGFVKFFLSWPRVCVKVHQILYLAEDGVLG